MKIKNKRIHLTDFILQDELPLMIVHPPVGAHVHHTMHDHDYTEIALVLDGSAIHDCNGETAQLTPGDVIMVLPGVPHCYRQAESLMIMNILCRPEKLLAKNVLEQFWNNKDAGNGRLSAGAEPVVHIEKKDWEKVLNTVALLDDALNTRLPGAPLAAIARFCDFLSIVMNNRHILNSRQVNLYLGEVIVELNHNFQNSIDIDTLCQRSHMSRRNFFLVFKKMTGLSPVRYVNNLRLCHAAQMLLISDASLTEIAMHCGFCDSNFLCKLFRQKYGQTPMEYRRQHTEHHETP